ncbi:hypothetical protein [Curtobacterium sp. Leaf261]|uniref:hypothetical protein n=1 Tax=Curtobacterium sp. Leaf261 TaxID=1736311 RepID=UPI0006F5AF0B|nr:hypothetical protein [Curtobacterium sp. Leaf261]KQO63662.1 hypothetical protein ASF23_05395 [Curtobacterium sp. Leaf261]
MFPPPSDPTDDTAPRPDGGQPRADQQARTGARADEQARAGARADSQARAGGQARHDPRARHAQPGTQVPAAGAAGATFAPISLRPAVDVAVIQERLQQLGQTRSTTALAERAELLRLLGRLDEALVIAEETFRLALFTGDRADGVAARIRRAHVLHDLGRFERAATESATARGTASTEDWHELEGAAAELEGWSLFELGRYEEARAALSSAHDAFRAAGAPAERTAALKSAIEESMRAFLGRTRKQPVDPQDAVRAAAARTELDR